MKNLIYSTVTLLLVIMMQSVSAANTPKGKPFIEIQGQLVAVEGQIKSLEEQMDELVGQVDSIEERVTANETAITSLENSNTVIQEQISTLITQAAENSTDVLAALNQISALQIEIDAMNHLLTDDIAAIQTQITELQDFVASNTEGLQTLISQLGNNNDLITALQNQTNDINVALAKKQDVLNGQCPDGTVLQSFDGAGNIQCEAPNATAGVSVTLATQIFPVTAKHTITRSVICGYNSWSCHCSIWSGCSTCTAPIYCPRTTEHIGTGSTSITCPDGQFLAGGGIINDHQEFVSANGTSSGTSDHPGQTWTVQATNTSGTQLEIYATANCVSFLPQ